MVYTQVRFLFKISPKIFVFVFAVHRLCQKMVGSLRKEVDMVFRTEILKTIHFIITILEFALILALV